DGKLISDNLNVSEFKKNNKQIITSIGDKIVNDWESGLVNPGLRVGYALASLICYQPSINKKQELISSSQDQQIDLKSTRFYKLMVNAIQDITLTDHWLIRLSIVLEWWNFFEMGLQELLSIHTSINRYYGNKDEVIIKKLWEDLMKRLDDVKFPITCQNIILALS
ncbi:21647_t:CDS:1, partial [Dentiscutata erythropus]